MKLAEYLHDHTSNLLVCFTGWLLLSVLLLSFGIHGSELFFLWICFILVICSTIFYNYRQQCKRIQYLLSLSDSLEQKYLIAEIADSPENKLEQIYFQLLKIALKDMTDEVAQSRRLQMEYRDFIEQWIHEIKIPITGIQLLCENHKSDITRKVLTQTELIEQNVERVLFYARLGSVEKDYFIKKISLSDCVNEVLTQNKQFLIQNGVCVDAEDVSDTVYTDKKWICFLLNQIIYNSIKYRSHHSPIIQMKSQDNETYVSLSITDNGIGIKDSELSRVFDKGFVGSNGRSGRNATGIGLYLCDQLCTKLGIQIDIKSQINQYTTVTLYFPKREHFNV